MDIFCCRGRTGGRLRASRFPAGSNFLARACLGSTRRQASDNEHGICRTSCQSQRSTDPGFSLPFWHAALLVKSRHRASTTLPFFSLDTYARLSASSGKATEWKVSVCASPRLSLLTNLGVYAQVLATGEAYAVEAELLGLLFFCFCHRHPIFHKTLQLGQSLLDLRYCSRAIHELPSGGIELSRMRVRMGQTTAGQKLTC